MTTTNHDSDAGSLMTTSRKLPMSAKPKLVLPCQTAAGVFNEAVTVTVLIAAALVQVAFRSGVRVAGSIFHRPVSSLS